MCHIVFFFCLACRSVPMRKPTMFSLELFQIKNTKFAIRLSSNTAENKVLQCGSYELTLYQRVVTQV